MMVNKSKVFPLKRILQVKSLNRLGEFDGQLDDIRPRKVDTNFLVLAGWHIGVTITGVVRFQFYWDQQFYVVWVFRCSLGKKNRFRLVSLVNFFNQHQTWLKLLKKYGQQLLS